MRLHELSTTFRKTPSLSFKSKWDFVKWMRSHAFTKLGEGTFSVVFQHDNLKRAVKVCQEDPGYMAFVDYCRSNSSNPHLPKLGRPIRITEDVFVIGMEWLQPIGKDDYDHVYKVCKQIEAEREGAEFADPMPRDGFYQTIEAIYEEGEKRNFLLDIKMNDENTMVRGEVLVVTDPWVTRLS